MLYSHIKTKKQNNYKHQLFKWIVSNILFKLRLKSSRTSCYILIHAHIRYTYITHSHFRSTVYSRRLICITIWLVNLVSCALVSEIVSNLTWLPRQNTLETLLFVTTHFARRKNPKSTSNLCFSSKWQMWFTVQAYIAQHKRTVAQSSYSVIMTMMMTMFINILKLAILILGGWYYSAIFALLFVWLDINVD